MNLVIKPGVRIEQSATKNILINNHSGEFYECNETALFLIQKILKGATQEMLVQSLLDTYDLMPKEAHIQVDYCLATLKSIGVLNEPV